MNVVNSAPTGISDDNTEDYCGDKDDDAAAAAAGCVTVFKRRSTCLTARRVMR